MSKRELPLFLALAPFVFTGGLAAQSGSYQDLSALAGATVVTMPGAAPSASSPSLEAMLLANADSDMTRWSSLFGATHKRLTKAAMGALSSPEFSIQKSNIISGSWSEAGHPNMSSNGGDVKAIWFGNSKAGIPGGVLGNYERFISSNAYQNIGIICHLTQDMAVPTHAANINHGLFVHNDAFEGYRKDDEITVAGGAEGALEPYAYYQLLQDDTRGKLPGWTDPATGKPYWVEPANRVPLGRDATYGERGHYGGADGADSYANKDVSASPEIHKQQFAAAAYATVEVVKAASRKLPPLVYDLKIEDNELKPGQSSPLEFGALDNSAGKVKCVISVYKDGSLVGIMAQGMLGMVPPHSWRMPYYSNHVKIQWTGMADSKTLPPGKYVLEVALTDADGNVVPEEVNKDGITENDTRINVTVK